jgi:hypothetical protein
MANTGTSILGKDDDLEFELSFSDAKRFFQSEQAEARY